MECHPEATAERISSSQVNENARCFVALSVTAMGFFVVATQSPERGMPIFNRLTILLHAHTPAATLQSRRSCSPHS
jgi:hypothetical protein